jgi:hypothetical protein
MKRTEALEKVCAKRPQLAAVEYNAEHESHMRLFLDLEVGALIGPSHKRTEERAPVWGSESTTKVATLQGGLVEIAATLNV